ncbi:unnamed protein product, partial [Cylindrotheca closterium]
MNGMTTHLRVDLSKNVSLKKMVAVLSMAMDNAEGDLLKPYVDWSWNNGARFGYNSKNPGPKTLRTCIRVAHNSSLDDMSRLLGQCFEITGTHAGVFRSLLQVSDPVRIGWLLNYPMGSAERHLNGNSCGQEKPVQATYSKAYADSSNTSQTATKSSTPQPATNPPPTSSARAKLSASEQAPTTEEFDRSAWLAAMDAELNQGPAGLFQMILPGPIDGFYVFVVRQKFAS